MYTHTYNITYEQYNSYIPRYIYIYILYIYTIYIYIYVYISARASPYRTILDEELVGGRGPPSPTKYHTIT